MQAVEQRLIRREAGFVEVWKGFQKNRPQTTCQITDVGRKRFLEYITVLENVVADTLAAAKAAPSAQTAKSLTEGWSPA